MNTHLTFHCQHQYDSGFTLDASFALTQPITAMCGPSGSGKTTTLSLIAGLLKPTSGRIQRHDQVLFDSAKRISLAAERRQVGLLFQDHCLFPHLTVADNIAFGQRRQQNRQKHKRNGTTIPVERVIQSLEISDIVNRYPRDISGGQQQRVALARALAASPKLLLLDEPLNSVEPELQERLSDVIRSVVAEFEIPALVVSHNRPLVNQLVDEVIEIRDGGIRN